METMISEISETGEKAVQACGKNFQSMARENPCDGCHAPCCRMLLIPHPTPATFMDLDYIRYMVGFKSVEMLLNSDGQWQVLVRQECSLLDQDSQRCTVHDTPRKPKTCVFFNPNQCWYKRNFSENGAADFVPVNMPLLEQILSMVRIDQNGVIAEVPRWETIRDMAGNGAA